MVGPCFVNVGDTTIRLSDIKVTGYENSSYYLEEEYAAPSVVVQRRLSTGQPYAQYSWYDESDGESWLGGSWVKALGEEDDPVLVPGDALWVQTPSLEDCEAFTFQVAGQVVSGAIAFPLNDGGKISACNPTPVTIKLSQVEVQGYENSTYYLEEEYAAPSVVIQQLLSTGQPYAQYSWYDESDGESWLGGSWVKAMGEYEPEELELKAGDGFWVQTPDLEDCEQFTLVFPSALN